MENQHKNIEVQNLLGLIAEARRMVEAGQGDTPITIGNVKFTARGLVEAADHIHSPPPSSPSIWERFLSTIALGLNSALKRLSLVSSILLMLALLALTIHLNSKLNRPDLLAIPIPVGQTLRQSEKELVQTLLSSHKLNGTSTLIAQHLVEGTCPSTGFWRNNESASLLVCFTDSDYPGALKWVDGEFVDGGVFSTENLLEFVKAHDLVLIHGGEQ